MGTRKLTKNLSVTIAPDCFVLAFLHNIEHLRIQSGSMIQENFEAVQDTPGWNMIRSDRRMLDQFLSDSFSKKMK